MKKFFTFQWHITDYCDQRCKHCYIFSDKAGMTLDMMTVSEMRQVLNNIENMCAVINRNPYFYITGGDPLLHPNFWDLMELIKKKKYRFTIMGNPFHLNNEVALKLKEFGCEKYQMSIDGMQDTHDYFRKKGSFQYTIEKLPCLKAAGIKSAIMTTVSDVNIKEIPDIIDLVVNQQVDIYAFARYCPSSQVKSNGILATEYRQLLHAIWEKYKEYKAAGATTYFNLKDHLWTLFMFEEGIFKIPAKDKKGLIYDGCHCADSHLTILPNGDVYACRRFESNVGNVFTEQLSDIFINKEEKYRMYEEFVKCSKCELKSYCRGCPAVAYSMTGNYYEADPQCWKELL